MTTRTLIEALNAHFEDGCEAASTAPRLHVPTFDEGFQARYGAEYHTLRALPGTPLSPDVRALLADLREYVSHIALVSR